MTQIQALKSSSFIPDSKVNPQRSAYCSVCSFRRSPKHFSPFSFPFPFQQPPETELQPPVQPTDPCLLGGDAPNEIHARRRNHISSQISAEAKRRRRKEKKENTRESQEFLFPTCSLCLPRVKSRGTGSAEAATPRSPRPLLLIFSPLSPLFSSPGLVPVHLQGCREGRQGGSTTRPPRRARSPSSLIASGRCRAN